MAHSRLSLIIPAYNAAATLDRCLTAAMASLPAGGECLVVDDSSTDRTGEIASAHGATVIRLDGGPHGPAYARNRGAEAAAGEILAFTDADCVLHDTTLVRMRDILDRDPEVAGVFGSYDDEPADPHFISQYKNLLHHYVHQTSMMESSSFWAGCGAVRAEAFHEVGGFPEQYPEPCIEDIHLGYLLTSHGYRMRLVKDLWVTHLKRWTFVSLVKTDIFNRGIPWTVLLLRTRYFSRDLNLQTHNPISVTLAYMLFGLVVFFLVHPRAWQVTLATFIPLTVVYLFLNVGLYLFFIERRGLWFTLKALPLHYLFYIYNGVSFAVGVVRHSITRDAAAG